MKELTKAIAIQIFNEWCFDEDNNFTREHSVKFQWQRNIWEVKTKGITIRVFGNGLIYSMHILPLPKCTDSLVHDFSNLNYSGLEFELTPEEYNILKNAYWDEYTFNEKVFDDMLTNAEQYLASDRTEKPVKVKLNAIFECEGKLYSIAIPENPSTVTNLSGGRNIYEFDKI